MRAPLILLMAALLPAAPPAAEYAWKHLSSANGDLPAPNRGNEQTSLTVADFNRDGLNDFVVTERTAADSVVLYLRGKSGWSRSVIEPQPLHVEAGSLALDVDGDGDLDFIAAGDYKSNEIWWWENPYPDLGSGRPWTRHIIKNSGRPKHHDQAAADFDGCGKPELVFWNQDAHALMIAKMPPDPRRAGRWPLTEIYRYSVDSEPQQHGGRPPASRASTSTRAWR